jgi:hypothetical protein
MKAPIKLLELDTVPGCGTRYQSQLLIGKSNIADFFLREVGQMEVWGGRGRWVPFEGEYEIVKSKEEMKYQRI